MRCAPVAFGVWWEIRLLSRGSLDGGEGVDEPRAVSRVRSFGAQVLGRALQDVLNVERQQAAVALAGLPQLVGIRGLDRLCLCWSGR